MRDPHRVGARSTGRALAGIGAYVLMAIGLTGLVGIVVPPGLVWGGLALLVGATVPGVLLLARDGRPLEGMGMPLDRHVPAELAWGFAAGLGAVAAVLALLGATGAVRWRPDGGGVVEFVAGGTAWALRLAVPALAEEVALRGYLLWTAAAAFGGGWALVGTSVLFGLLHLGNPEVGGLGIAGIVAAGLVLGALVLRTGALWWAAGAHLGWNWALAWPADLPVSGLELADTPGLDAAVAGPAWWSGGAFGPEASAAAVLVLSASAAWVWWGRGLVPAPTRTKREP